MEGLHRTKTVLAAQHPTPLAAPWQTVAAVSHGGLARPACGSPSGLEPIKALREE
jgi:hypothetical protein